MLWRKVIFINSLPLAGFVLGCKEHEKVWTHKCDVTKHRVWVCWGSGTVWRHQGHEEEPKLWKTCSHQNDCGNYACIPFICLMTCNIFFFAFYGTILDKTLETLLVFTRNLTSELSLRYPCPYQCVCALISFYFVFISQTFCLEWQPLDSTLKRRRGNISGLLSKDTFKKCYISMKRSRFN